MLCDCGEPLIEIDCYGERSQRVLFELFIEDFEALRELQVNGRQVGSIR
jgi:hypothetical protein